MVEPVLSEFERWKLTPDHSNAEHHAIKHGPDDRAERGIRSAMWAAFVAGWRAAGGRVGVAEKESG